MSIRQSGNSSSVKKKRSERCKEHGSEMSNRGSEQIFSQKLNTLLHRISHQLGNVLAWYTCCSKTSTCAGWHKRHTVSDAKYWDSVKISDRVCCVRSLITLKTQEAAAASLCWVKRNLDENRLKSAVFLDVASTQNGSRTCSTNKPLWNAQISLEIPHFIQ